MSLSVNMRSSLLMAAAMAGFTTNDALVKMLGGTVGAGQIMMVRGAIMLAAMLLFVRIARTPMPIRRAMTGAMALRAAGEVIGTVFFLFALFHMPIANVSAVLQALPLAVTLGAALVLKEPVGIRRLSAILIGFGGVVLIIRPGMEGFTVYSLAALATAAFAAMRDLATRRLPTGLPTLTFSLLTTVAVTATGAVMMMFSGGWKPLQLGDLGLLCGSALFLIIAYQCVILALRDGDMKKLVFSDPQPAGSSDFQSFEGEPLNLSDYRGKWVLVNFWATWCGPCRTEFPEFVRFDEEMADQNVHVRFVAIQEASAYPAIRAFLAEHEVTDPSYLYTGPGDLTSQLNPMVGGALPITMILNGDGIVQDTHVGEMSYDELAASVDAARSSS